MQLFQVIDGGGTCELSSKEFLDGCLKMKGCAMSKDMLQIQAQADTLSRKMDDLGLALQNGERMMASLDEITLRMQLRYHPTVRGSRQKIAARVGGSAPVVQDHIANVEDAPLSTGNKPALPLFPN